MRRFATLALSLMLSLSATQNLFAQEEPPAETPTPEQAPAETPTPDEPQAEDPAPAEDPEPADAATPADSAEIPEEVQEKLEAARKAVAEAIAAAEQAGLVETNLDVPPILDILVTGRATDKTELETVQDNPDQQVGLTSPEAFGAYFTEHADIPNGVVPQTNVRIRQPSEGLKAFYDERSSVMQPYLQAAREALGLTDEPQPEAAEEEPEAEEPEEEPEAEEEPETEEEPQVEPEAEESEEEPQPEETEEPSKK